MKNKNLYFILSSSCRVVNGVKRNVIIDYSRKNLYFISHDYYALIKKMDRCKIQEMENEIEDDSVQYFNEFLDFLEEYEIGFFTENPENFPKINEELPDEDYILLLDVIIEIDERYYDKSKFEQLCLELAETNCKDFQIRLLSKFNLEILQEVVDLISGTNANYIEIHCSWIEESDMEIIQELVANKSKICNVFVYECPEIKIIDVINDNSDCYHPISLGKIYLLDYSFDQGNCCGVINQHNLSYTNFYSHSRLQVRNGCLDRKLTIDRFGNFKNCPSMNAIYGNSETTSVKQVIQDKNFQKLWYIIKDQISICNVCEFRYNCTDCRAFIQDQNDIYSKPLKCGYDPFTAVWKDEVPLAQKFQI